jgi:glycosyltransferase involved in cell wall biosynthesis
MLDALAAGIPVIAADGPAARQCIAGSENGCLYPLGDAKALADAVFSVMERDQLLGGRPGKCLAQTPAAEAAEYLSLIEQLRR